MATPKMPWKVADATISANPSHTPVDLNTSLTGRDSNTAFHLATLADIPGSPDLAPLTEKARKRLNTDRETQLRKLGVTAPRKESIPVLSDDAVALSPETEPSFSTRVNIGPLKEGRKSKLVTSSGTEMEVFTAVLKKTSGKARGMSSEQLLVMLCLYNDEAV